MKHPLVRRRRFLSTIAGAVILAGCGGGSSSSDPELRQAEQVIRHLTSPRHLRLSTYLGTMQTGKASELVSFLFSSMGAAEWPPADDASGPEQEQARAVGAPLVPRGVVLRPFEPDRSRPDAKQLVVSADDTRNVIIVNGYVRLGEQPVLTEEWAMPDTSRVRPGAK